MILLTSCIYTELLAIYQELILAKNLNIIELRFLYRLLALYKPPQRPDYEITCLCCLDPRCEGSN